MGNSDTLFVDMFMILLLGIFRDSHLASCLRTSRVIYRNCLSALRDFSFNSRHMAGIHP